MYIQKCLNTCTMCAKNDINLVTLKGQRVMVTLTSFMYGLCLNTDLLQVFCDTNFLKWLIEI
jgi:hypothetical protein